MEIGQKIIHLNSVDSTNNYVANLLNDGKIANGTVVLADSQHAGRGQRDAFWVANAGENLTFTVFLDNVNLSVSKQFYLNQLVSLSLIRFLSKFGVAASIKWPNDIFVSGKKIGGVLIENQLSSDQIKSSIIGIGININQQVFQGFKATSTFLETGQYRIPKDILFVFIDVFNKTWQNYSPSYALKAKEQYDKFLYLLNQTSQFEDREGSFDGKIVEVLDSGVLVVEKKGKNVYYNSKEILFKL